MTRASEDQYRLSLRCLYDDAAALRRAIRTIERRLAVPADDMLIFGRETPQVSGVRNRSPSEEMTQFVRLEPPDMA